jgi:anaerobic ribonucleoside-triphosphate reductase activating protein
MKLRLAGLVPESVVDGPGIRFVVFAQGCPHHCPGCHNPETWDPEAGKLVEVEEILSMIAGARLLKGVTFSGGEPFLQAEALSELARGIKKLGLDLMVYTGYEYEELLELARTRPAYMELLELTDILVAGPDVRRSCAFISCAIMLARVVFPNPGGPYNSTWSRASPRARAAWIKMDSVSFSRSCPVYSARVCGRSDSSKT